MAYSLGVEVLNAFQHLLKYALSFFLGIVVNLFNLIHELHSLCQLHHLVDFTLLLSLEHSFTLHYINVVEVLNNTEFIAVLLNNCLFVSPNTLDCVRSFFTFLIIHCFW